ncbi:MAG: hypothetical protein ACF8SC_13020 [Phycisphaerales bacterium JB037]
MTRSGRIGSALALLLASIACAQPAPPEPNDPLPTLDELLGLEPTRRPDRPDRELPLADPSQRELERQLSGEEMGEQFRQAVALMDESADRLETISDTGLLTQRLQEDVIRKLDQIINSSNQANSSSSQRQQQQQQQQSQQQQPAQPGQDRDQGQTTDPQSTQLPGAQSGDLGPPAAVGAAWGELPPRLRDALLQGLSDPFSSMYRTMTESYYRRLAEEGRR